MSSSVPIRPDLPPDHEATSSERSEIVDRIIDAADGERLDIDEAGRLVSLAYRAQQRDDLLRISRRLAVVDDSLRSAARRRQQWQTLGWLVVFALVSTLMIVGLLSGLGPVDPH